MPVSCANCQLFSVWGIINRICGLELALTLKIRKNGSKMWEKAHTDGPTIVPMSFNFIAFIDEFNEFQF
jgi:hypothetical protein